MMLRSFSRPWSSTLMMVAALTLLLSFHFAHSTNLDQNLQPTLPRGAKNDIEVEFPPLNFQQPDGGYDGSSNNNSIHDDDDDQSEGIPTQFEFDSGDDADSTQPTISPSSDSTLRPTLKPTVSPTSKPTTNPIYKPSINPTTNPTQKPTRPPTVHPTKPTKKPTAAPTRTPTVPPTSNPTRRPTLNPTITPTRSPTSAPTKRPTKDPTVSPTKNACPPGNFYHGSQKDCQFLKLEVRPYINEYLSSVIIVKGFAPQAGVCSTLRTIIAGNKKCWNNGKSATYEEAQQICERDGMRLCTNAELQAGYGIPKRGSDDEEKCYDKSFKFWTSTPCSLRSTPFAHSSNKGRLLQRLDGTSSVCKDEEDKGNDGPTGNRVICCADSIVFQDVHDRPCLKCVDGSTSPISNYFRPALGEDSCIAGAVKAPTSVDNHFTESPTVPKQEKPNVLFIVVDDLKAGLVGGFNPSDTNAKHTPNIDALIRRGIGFSNAHAQQAECGPSRASFLTGKRPDYIGVTDFVSKLRSRFPDVTTLPQLFKDNGYRAVIGYGKVFDGRNTGGDTNQDFPSSWTRRIYNPDNTQADYVKEKYVLGDCGYKDPVSKNSVTQCAQDGNDLTYMDGQYADEVVKALAPESLALVAPWFLAVGFSKPHLPFVAPGSYWSKFDRNGFSIQVKDDHEDNGVPVGGYDFSQSDNNEIAKYAGFPSKGKGRMNPSDEVRLRVYHGYYAATSYVDAQVGKVVEGLKQRPIEEQQNTLIVLLGDHGFHLGDHDMYAKATIFEDATNAPLVIVPPLNAIEYDKSRGKISRAPVEFVDILPTVADLTKVLDKGTCDTNPSDCLVPDIDGISLKPILLNPTNHPGLSKYAISQVRAYCKDKIISYALRTWRYRYVVHVLGDIAGKGKVVGRELYDYVADPRARKSFYSDSNYRSIVSQFEIDFQNARSLRWSSIKGESPFDFGNQQSILSNSTRIL